MLCCYVILSRLWTKVYEILLDCSSRIVFNAVFPIAYSLFLSEDIRH